MHIMAIDGLEVAEVRDGFDGSSYLGYICMYAGIATPSQTQPQRGHGSIYL